ncbi:MAG TPA: hypothetical protein PKK43_01640 [Spirochaetota bacterium]|nr:hypothetical protein [Spirochaetota bacterium]
MDNISNYIRGFVLGDALGSVYDGMSRGHITSHFRDEKGFPDTVDAQKGHYDRWRKPGLYGGLSQLFIIAALLGCERPSDYNSLSRFLSKKGRVLDTTSGIFRAPGRLIEEYLISVYRNCEGTVTYDLQSASVLPLVSGGCLSMLAYACPAVPDMVKYATSLHSDLFGSVGASLHTYLLHRIFVSNDDSPLRMALEESRRLKNDMEECQPELFKAGVNPDKCIETAAAFADVFEKLSDVTSCDEAEKRIVAIVNRYMKTPVTRATIDHPLAIFPFAAVIASLSGGNAVRDAAGYGGSAAVLTSMTGGIASAAAADAEEEILPPELVEALVNRKSVWEYSTLIAAGNGEERAAEEFFSREIALTSKEIDEKSAKLKHLKAPEQKKRTTAEKEAFLTRHVVESWTKNDKAKWRKQRRGMDDEIQE